MFHIKLTFPLDTALGLLTIRNFVFHCVIAIALMIMQTSSAQAQLSTFKDGPLIKSYGRHASVENINLPASTKLKVAFDVAAAAEPGKINRRFDSLARFLNMHVAAGLSPENIELALVVHGKGAFDLLDDPTYEKLNNQNNLNKALLNELIKNGVKVYLCGQTAKAYEISESQLVSGAKLHLSAMTAHAVLQQQGYTVNPF